ncbi:lipolysis-stimulated lipoprotein receptor isoform X2 [Narcine bancroftii]|uniref:lipolysis-stimulated lipoprotein receptor isoform X2 n=1 Tax=Narcine bancroftii TaxID=1343680 RepID=UPI0038312353
MAGGAGTMGPWLVAALLSVAGICGAIQVDTPNPWQVAILFQPVVLKCQYQSTTTEPPMVVWKYKSFCRSRLQDAFNPSSPTSQVNDQLLQADPNYNPYVNCPDTSRTVRSVASKQGKAVTLGDFYQGRKITIIGDADLSIEQTAWGDSGVYYCTVNAFGDLSGNNEAYVELLVLDWLFVVLVLLGALLLVILISICWCQCCPHTCCCYLRCPCCPDRCCCPHALYHAGKAATAGVPSIYAPSSYAPSAYVPTGHMNVPPPHPVMVPMTQFNGSYSADFDGASSVGNHSRVPLLHDQDTTNSVRSGYRIRADQNGDDMRVLYYVEKELAQFDPRDPRSPVSKYENASAMSEISSLHEARGPRGFPARSRQPALAPIGDEESDFGSASQWGSSRHQYGRALSHQRARSMESLDDGGWWDYSHHGWRADHGREPPFRRGSDADSPGPPSRRRGPIPVGRRSRSRDDLSELEAGRRFRRDDFLRERPPRGAGSSTASSALSAPQRNGREKHPPLPPPYEAESVSSRGKNEKRLRKNDAVSRESLVV